MFVIITILSSFITYNKSNMAGATSEAGTANLPENLNSPLIFTRIHVVQSLVYCVVFCRSLFASCLLCFEYWFVLSIGLI